jgi:hypothetical protein
MNLPLTTFFGDIFHQVSSIVSSFRWDTIVTALATLLGAFLGAYLATYFTEKRAAKAEHFRALKKGVIEPILAKLTSYHLPLLELKHPNIIPQTVPVDEETKDVTSPQIKSWRKELGIPSPNPDTGVDQVLYGDAKENHLKNFIRRWENYEQKVAGYHLRCMRLAKEFVNSIRCEVENFPEEPIPPLGRSFIDAVSIGSWILRRQMGIFPNDFLARESEQSTPNILWIKDGYLGRQLAGADNTQIETLLKLINKLAKAYPLDSTSPKI